MLPLLERRMCMKAFIKKMYSYKSSSYTRNILNGRLTLQIIGKKITKESRVPDTDVDKL